MDEIHRPVGTLSAMKRSTSSQKSPFAANGFWLFHRLAHKHWANK